VRQAVQRLAEKSCVDIPQLRELMNKILGTKTHPDIKEDERFAVCIASLRRSETGDLPEAPARPQN
jgi:hypothetical protein